MKDAEIVKLEESSQLAHGAEGTAAGAVAGALLGAAAGPPGMIAGAVIGSVAGVIAAVALDKEAALQAEYTRALDAELGVTEGDLGAPIIGHSEHEERRAPSAASLGLDGVSGGLAAEGPIPAPED